MLMANSHVLVWFHLFCSGVVGLVRFVVLYSGLRETAGTRREGNGGGEEARRGGERHGPGRGGDEGLSGTRHGPSP